MSRRKMLSRVRTCAILLITLTLGMPALAVDPYIGEVTNTSSQVNVRSGQSTNFYVVTRLNPGDRVTVIAEENGWCGIVPPDGCYSLVSEHYVDVGAHGEGVINGAAVRVRAGSDLDEHRYAVQTKLDKGAEVRVLGKAGDGFLKIAPPAGAKVWISSEFVLRVPQDRLGGVKPVVPGAAQTAAARNTPTPAAVEPLPAAQNPMGAQQPVSGPSDVDDGPALVARPAPPVEDDGPAVVRREAPAPAPSEGAQDDSAPGADAAPAVNYRSLLQVVEKQFKDEMAKPLGDRRLADLIEAYQPLAAQDSDSLVRMYAERRVQQLELSVETAKAIRDIRNLADDVEKDRKEALDARATIRPVARPIMRGFEAKGELRKSMIYASPVGPQRYRLVDPDLVVPRTLCYVEVASDANLNMENFVGRMVGVRARERYVETGNVDPIPVLVADDLVVLDRPAADDADGADLASPELSEDAPNGVAPADSVDTSVTRR